jgi:sugar/nucleoside kinase (ribokinase family)
VITGIPSYVVESSVSCGAGDVWNAGLIYSILQSFSPADSILVANAVAALYVSSQNAHPPSLDSVRRILESPPPTSEHGNKLLMR